MAVFGNEEVKFVVGLELLNCFSSQANVMTRKFLILSVSCCDLIRDTLCGACTGILY